MASCMSDKDIGNNHNNNNNNNNYGYTFLSGTRWREHIA
jgi:hypothetical protein